MKMEEPKYLPESWVIFDRGGVNRFGKIVGGTVIDGEWTYFIDNPVTEGILRIKESDISDVLKK